jgi:hypothetical protein
MISELIMIGGGIFAFMGLAHGLGTLLDVFRPTLFTPMDDSVRVGMRSTGVKFTGGRADMWNAWLGFNLSHSLGVLIFGAAAVWLGLNMDQVKVTSSMLVAPIVIGLIYLILSIRFWFFAPTIGSAVATGFFVVALWNF